MAIPTNKLQYVAFSTKFNYEHIQKKGSIATTLGATVTVPHGLTYKPYAKVWINWGGGFQHAVQHYNSAVDVIWRTDTTNLIMQPLANTEGSFGQAITLYYRIYKEVVT